jgi:hypothetical protein
MVDARARGGRNVLESLRAAQVGEFGGSYPSIDTPGDRNVGWEEVKGELGTRLGDVRGGRRLGWIQPPVGQVPIQKPR